MQFVTAIIFGILFGVANVIPGVSGGTILVITGCYNKVCGALALDFKAIKKNFLFLVFFGVGGAAGILAFAKTITFLLEKFPVQTYLFFIGLILGGIPLINKLATKGEGGEKWNIKCVIPFVLGLGLIIWLFLLERSGVSGADSSAMSIGFAFRLAAYSAVAAIAMVIPGVSGSFMLLAFGVYDTFMEALSGFDFKILIPAGIGILIGLVSGARLIMFLMKRFRLIVYAAIMGMVIGSLLPLFPSGFGLNIATATGVVCMAVGIALTIFMSKIAKSENG